MAQLPPFLLKRKSDSSRRVNYENSQWFQGDLLNALTQLTRDTENRVRITHTRIEEWTARVRRTASYSNAYTVEDVEALLHDEGEYPARLQELKVELEQYVAGLSENESTCFRMWLYLNDVGMPDNMPEGRKEIALMVDAEITRLYRNYASNLFEYFETHYMWDDEACDNLTYEEEYDDVYVDDYDHTVDSWNDHDYDEALGGLNRVTAPIIAAVQRYREVRRNLRTPYARANEERSR